LLRRELAEDTHAVLFREAVVHEEAMVREQALVHPDTERGFRRREILRRGNVEAALLGAGAMRQDQPASSSRRSHGRGALRELPPAHHLPVRALTTTLLDPDCQRFARLRAGVSGESRPVVLDTSYDGTQNKGPPVLAAKGPCSGLTYHTRFGSAASN